MARLIGVPDAVYVALARVRKVTFQDGGALFLPPGDIWTTKNLLQLAATLGTRNEEGAPQSLLKLRSYLEGLSADIVRLAAELLYVQQMFGSFTSSDKLRNVRQVLSWVQEPVEIPAWAIDGVGFGLADDQAFNQDRLVHLLWLARATSEIRQHASDQLAEDPWKFRELVASLEPDRVSVQPMREALLYLLFPDTFENISSRDDKWHIREAFPHVLARGPSEQLDADLLAIRRGLTPTFGEGFHFYSNEVAVNWRASVRNGPLPDLPRDEVLNALQRFDTEERVKSEWSGWETNSNYKFALSHDGKLYPPKHVVSLATHRLKSGFSGGEQTNRYLTDRGFVIVQLRDADGTATGRPAANVPQPNVEAPAIPAVTDSESHEPTYPAIAVARTKSSSQPEPEPPPVSQPDAPAQPLVSKRDIVELLKRDELQAALEQYDLHVEDRRVNEQLVDALVASKKVRIAEILSHLSRDRLKELCNGLDLDDSGREKIVLIERILGEQADEDQEGDRHAGENVVDAAADLVRLLGPSLTDVSRSNGWPMTANLLVGDTMHPVSIYVRAIGGSARGNALERRFQNPSQQSPIVDDPDRYELLLGVWTEQGADRAVIVAFDPYRRMDRTTRFSLFMPVSLLEQAADTGFATHENTRGETLYAFRAENLGRYIDAQVQEGHWKKTRPSEPTMRRLRAEPKPAPVAALAPKRRTADDQSSIYIRPQVGMYSAFARLNYRPWFALAEFLDNSIQSFLNNRAALETDGHEGPLIIDLNLDDNEISVTDRAGGINWESFPRAFSPAAPPDDPTGLSEFGLGMKAAACWFSRKWNVRTSALGEAVERTVTFDIPEISKTGLENLPIETRPGRKSDHFTVITMHDLRVHPRGKTLQKIREHLGSIYRVLMQDGVVRIRLTMGGRTEELAYEAPPLLEAPYFRAQTERPRLWRQEFEVELGDRRVTGWAGIMQSGSHGRAGFSVFRRRRLIEGSVGETYKPHQIFGAPNSFRSLRVVGELFVEGFDVTHTKDGIQWHGYEDEVLTAIQTQINSPRMPLLDQAEGYRVRVTATSLPKDFGNEALIGVADALSQPTAIEAIRATDATPEPALQEAPAPPTVVIQQRTFKLQAHSEGQPWEIHLELVRDPAKPFFSSSTSGNSDAREKLTLSVQLNLEHEFSISYLNDNESALPAVLRIVAALALAEKSARDAGVPDPGAIRRNANKILNAISESTKG